jgi:hypothetical protein
MFGQLDSLGSHSCRPQTLSENQSSVRVRAANCVRVSQARSSASCEHTLLRMSKCKGPSLSCRSDGWLNRTVKIRAERKRTVGTHHVHVRARANEKQAPITASLYGMLIFSHDTTALYHARRNHVVRNLVERATVARTSRGGGGGGGHTALTLSVCTVTRKSQNKNTGYETLTKRREPCAILRRAAAVPRANPALVTCGAAGAKKKVLSVARTSTHSLARVKKIRTRKGQRGVKTRKEVACLATSPPSQNSACGSPRCRLRHR